MFKFVFITVVTIFCINQEILAVVLDEGQVEAALREKGFPEDKLKDWVCLVMAESSGDTQVIGPPNDDGSKDFGLFQINSKYWCSDSETAGNGCNVRCEDVKQDDITSAAECAKKVFNQQGFQAWTGWKNKCQ